MLKGYGLGDDGKLAPLIDTVERAFKPYDEPADDVRLAIHQCSTGDGDTKSAYSRLAAVARDEGVAPAEMIAGLDKVDEASWENANVAVALVDGYAQQPKYKQAQPEPEYEGTYGAVRAAVKHSMSAAVSPEDYKKAVPYLKRLAHRNGSAAEFIDNALHLREQALAGGQAYQQARQTAYGHYRSWNGAKPVDALATRDMHQAAKVFPDIKSNTTLNDAVSKEIQNGDFPLSMTGVEVAAEARRRVLERQYNDR